MSMSLQASADESFGSTPPAAAQPRTTASEEVTERQAAGWTRSVMIIATAIGLMGIGAVMSFSASVDLDSSSPGQSMWDTRIVKQMICIIGGLATMLIASRLPYRMWCAGNGLLALIALLFSMGLTCLTFVPGVGLKINEAYRWVRLPFGFSFQPSEVVKITLPIFLAVYMTRGWDMLGQEISGDDDSLLHGHTDISRFFRGLLPAIVAIGICGGIVGLEDFGTAALIGAVAGAMLLVGGARILHLMLLVLPVVPAVVFLLFSRAHRMSRLTTFMNIWEDPGDKGYQVVQSLCTIVSGGWFGRGLGRGFVKGYLPEAPSDFIFAVIHEELGFVGAVTVISLLIAFMWQCRIVIRDCVDPMGKLLAFGIALTIGLQAAMNIAVVTVSVPTKGISLPLVSAGGSGAIFLGALVGVLASIPRQCPWAVRTKG